MSKIAIIRTGGKQYVVRENDNLKVEKINKKEGDKVMLEALLIATTDGKEVQIGKPSLGEKVEAKLVEQFKDDKVRVIKYKSKTRYLRNKGHRQNLSKIEITSIK